MFYHGEHRVRRENYGMSLVFFVRSPSHSLRSGTVVAPPVTAQRPRSVAEWDGRCVVNFFGIRSQIPVSPGLSALWDFP